MTTSPPHDRIFSLEDVNAYPGEPLLDRVVQIHWSPDSRRRVWMQVPEGAPELRIANKSFWPQNTFNHKHRWIDYGVIELPGLEHEYPIWDGMTQLAFSGLKAEECPHTWLVIATDLELSLAGRSMEEAQRILWGLAQEDVGSTSLNPAIMEVGQTGPLQVRYRAGARGLPAGAIIRFAVAKVMTTPQTEDPQGDGYVEIVEADANVAITKIQNMLETHEKSSIHCRLLEDLPPGRGFVLRYRTGRNFLFPRTFDEVEMRTWFSNLPPLTASAARDSDSPFVNMLPENGHSFTLKPGPSKRLHLFLPGRRYTGESITLRGTYTDKYRNVPPAGMIDVDYQLWLDDGKARRLLGTPTGSFQNRHRFSMDLPPMGPGVYRVYAIREGSGEEVARSNPLEIVPEGLRERLYWGEIHCHTGLTDVRGPSPTNGRRAETANVRGFVLLRTVLRFA